jgi:hypothetical protein
MPRLIFIGLVIWLIYSLVKRSFGSPRPHEHNKSSSSKTKEAEDMVQCAHCAVHLPRSEAFLVNGHLYCSKEHIQKQ